MTWEDRFETFRIHLLDAIPALSSSLQRSFMRRAPSCLWRHCPFKSCKMCRTSKTRWKRRMCFVHCKSKATLGEYLSPTTWAVLSCIFPHQNSSWSDIIPLASLVLQDMASRSVQENLIHLLTLCILTWSPLLISRSMVQLHVMTCCGIILTANVNYKFESGCTPFKRCGAFHWDFAYQRAEYRHNVPLSFAAQDTGVLQHSKDRHRQKVSLEAAAWDFAFAK